MMFTKKRLFQSLSLCLLLASSAQATISDAAPANQEIACRYSQKKKMASGEAKLNFIGNKLNRVYFNVYYAGGMGELSYACDIAWSRADVGYVWKDTALGTVITIKDTGDRVELMRDKKNKGYLLNFASLNRLSKWCGTGAEVPEDVFIPLSGKSCKVSLSH